MRLPPTVQTILGSDHGTTILVNATAIAYSASWAWGQSEYFTLEYQAVLAAGTVGLKIEVEVGNVRPTTEGSADTTNYAVPEDAQNVESALADTSKHFKKLSPVTSLYGRLKITGVGANDAGTVLASKLVRQEEV